MKSWFVMGALFVLCGALGVLQYRWIGEVTNREGDRLRAALQVNLARLSQDFNNEIGSAVRALIPVGAEDVAAARADLEQRYGQAKQTNQNTRLIRRMGIAVPQNGSPSLELIEPGAGQLKAAEWPSSWEEARERIGARASGGMPGPTMPAIWGDGESLIFDTPLFRGGGGRGPGRPSDRAPGREFGRREMAWLIYELNLDYLRTALLPEVAARHLDLANYHVEVITRAHPRRVVWSSDAAPAGPPRGADAAIGLLDARIGGPFEGGRGRGGRVGPGRGPESGRWTMLVRHRAGSVEAVVAQTRVRNLAVTGGVLLLMMAAVWTLFRNSRNAERLADMQMNFVAGVSHELRTPLTAIYTAGHNLRGRVAHNPSQVERYGEMIQQESGRLRELVEQVLRFASINAGRVIQEPTPVSPKAVIEDSLEASRCVLEGARYKVEKRIEEGLPPVMADPLALKQALQNLLANAMKYGTKEDPWIGVFAERTADGVEIRVADRGPGIPPDEQKHIFDAFYRGRRAVQDQAPGAGLGLNLVKRIVEAHGGSIRVKSAPGEGAEFIVRIPAAQAGAQA